MSPSLAPSFVPPRTSPLPPLRTPPFAPPPVLFAATRPVFGCSPSPSVGFVVRGIAASSKNVSSQHNPIERLRIKIAFHYWYLLRRECKLLKRNRSPCDRR